MNEMEPATVLTRTEELAEEPRSASPKDPLLAAVLAAALVAYRRHLSKTDMASERGTSEAHWQALGRWQQLAPTTQHQLQRQR